MDREKHTKKKLVIVLAVILVIMAVSGMIAKNAFCRNKCAVDWYSSFWDDPDQYDVWFMGSSHTYYSIYPMELYDKYGITSYDIATPSSTLPMTYWTLKNALRKGTPEVVFIDVYHLDMDNPLVQDRRKVHIGFDAIPMSLTKIRAINDLVSDRRFRWELYIPVYLENGPHEGAIAPNKNARFKLNRGAKVKTAAVAVEPKRIDGTLDHKTRGMEYLEKIIDECNKRDIELVIAAMPFNGKNNKLKGLNTGVDMAAEYGVPCFDMRYCPEFIDYEHEFNKDGHLNYDGAVRMTDRIGEFITDRFEVTDHRATGDSIKTEWDADLIEYKEFIEEKTKKNE